MDSPDARVAFEVHHAPARAQHVIGNRSEKSTAMLHFGQRTTIRLDLVDPP